MDKFRAFFNYLPILLGLAAISVAAPVRAEDADSTAAESADTSKPAAQTPAPAATQTASKSRNPKGKRPREKEIEGTEARDRFQADTVLKSKYQSGGEQLEVDPD